MFHVLLVDAEGPVTASPRTHLHARDGWTLSTDEEGIHLMAQVSETWLLADAAALARYYGQGFRATALPATSDLEKVAKADVFESLQRATRETKKGGYHKIRDASALLPRLDVAKVTTRCAHCHRLFDVLRRHLETA